MRPSLQNDKLTSRNIPRTQQTKENSTIGGKKPPGTYSTIRLGARDAPSTPKLYTDLKLEFLGGFPGEVHIVTAEMAVGSGLRVYRAKQVKVADDTSGTEIKVVHDNLSDLRISLLTGSISVNKDGEGLSDTDTIR